MHSEHAIADTGATDTFICPATKNITNMRHDPTTQVVRMPNGDALTSNTKCDITMPAQIPSAAAEATVLPGLQQNLISIAKLCDNGLNAYFAKDYVHILSKQNEVVWRGTRDESSGLWKLPLTQQHYAHTMITTKPVKDMVKFLYLALFSPSKTTLIKAINKGLLSTWPQLTEANINKYIINNEASIKGHLKHIRKNLQSTKNVQQNEDTMHPKTEAKTHTAYTTIAEIGKIYSDQTGKFTFTSSQGNKYVFIMYIYDANAIIATPIKSREKVDILEAHKNMVMLLNQRGLQPKVHWLDNEASNDLIEFNKDLDIQMQLVPPYVHRRNAAERAIQTWKSHFIAGLCSIHPHFPMHLWDRLIPQANDTLNMLRVSRINPKLSAYDIINGPYNYMATPMAPPGCKAIIWNPQRRTWDPKGLDAWYIGRAPMHYRCYEVYIPDTKGFRISDTVEFLPHLTDTPYFGQTEAIITAAQDLTHALKPGANTPAMLQALKELSDIFTNYANPPKAEPVPPTRVFKHETPQHATTTQYNKLPRTVQHRYPTRSRVQAANFLRELVNNQNHIYPYTLHSVNAIINETTGAKMEYRHLIKNPALADRWENSFANELGRLAQGRTKTGLPGTSTIFFTPFANIPENRRKDITYGRIVVDYRPQKDEPHRTRLTAGGNLINYPGVVTTKTAELSTSKLHFNSVLSTPNGKFMTADVGNFYLNTILDRYEYMFLPYDIIPKEIVEQYELDKLIHNGKIYMEIRKGMYGLPQAGIIANKKLQKILEPHGYYPCRFTAGLWKHKTRNLTFTLVVDDFGIKYTNKQDALHLLEILKDNYPKVAIDWEGSLYCGITLDWDYGQRTVTLSMPNYLPKVLHKCQHLAPLKPQYSPHPCRAIQYGAKQTPVPDDTSDLIEADAKQQVQEIVGSLLYYARALDLTMLPALTSISRQQNNPTQDTVDKLNQLLDYCHTYPNTKVRYHASGMLLKVHTDASYLSEPQARSRVGGYFYLGSRPVDAIDNNGAITVNANIIQPVVTSAAEAEYAGMFLNVKTALPLRLALLEMGHPQPPTPVISDNTTAVGLANDSVKQKFSKAMDMRFHFVQDQVNQNTIQVIWKPGALNFGDYLSKHHPAKYHQKMRPFYVLNTVTLRGCVRTTYGTGDRTYTYDHSHSTKTIMVAIERIRDAVRKLCGTRQSTDV